GRAAIAVTADLRDAGGRAVSPQNTRGSIHPDPPVIHTRFAATADSADSAVIAGMSTGVWVWSASAVTNSRTRPGRASTGNGPGGSPLSTIGSGSVQDAAACSRLS